MSAATTTTPNEIKIAILDDYANIAPPYFTNLTSTTPISITYHGSTLNPNSPTDLPNLITRLQPYSVIISMRERTPFTPTLLTSLPNLRLLLTTGTRNRGIDLPTCRNLSIPVAGTGAKPNYVPGHSDTNEQNWALILGLAKHVVDQDLRVKTTDAWQIPGELVFGLAGRTLGLLGFGRLGVQCAITGTVGFGMKAIAWSENLTQEKADAALRERGLSPGSVRVVGSKEELVREADVLSVHYVLGERSRGMLGLEELGWMKSTALLVNTSRGPIVDEAALLEVLREGRIRGAALDVFDIEPLPADSPWRSTEWGKNGRSHVLVSPHAGYMEEETMHHMYKENAENLQRWLNGEELVNLLE